MLKIAGYYGDKEMDLILKILTLSSRSSGEARPKVSISFRKFPMAFLPRHGTTTQR
jgi:hypothetical protein